jgi:two-component system phosphate regulon response regulator PhoB
LRNASRTSVLLDWMLPKLAGIEVARRLRSKAATRNLPIIMLTARTEESDRIRGLDIGADDYMTKPFSMSELTARIPRGAAPHPSGVWPRTVVDDGDIVHRPRRPPAFRAGGQGGPPRARRSSACWTHLMQHPGRVFSREQLLDAVWGSDVYVEARTVDVHVGRLRKALNVEGGQDRSDPDRALGRLRPERLDPSV